MHPVAIGRYWSKLAREARQRESVASVHVPVKLLTNKERERLIKVEELVGRGVNPYNASRMKEEGKNLGGALERVIDYSDREQLNEAAHAALLKKWSERVLDQDEPLYLDDIDMDVPIAQDVTPGEVLCSFCGKSTPRITSTVGKGEPKISVLLEPLTVGDEVTIIERKIFRQRKAIACPACCLNLKTTDRDGKVTYHADFPSNE